MALPSTADLIRMLIVPAETLTVEHKGWLDFSTNPHKAILAKAAIALANEGGGIIVLGTREDNSQGAALGSYPRPTTLLRYSLDDINAAIRRFADPEFHCQLVFAVHPETSVEHAFVIVPGGMTVPVMSCRGSDGEIQQQRCYIRKPGPRSEEPYTAEEWRGVLERCLQARRETMLDAIRAIVQGRPDAPSVPITARAQLTDFITASEGRWRQRIDPLPPEDVARMIHGHYEIAFSFIGIEPASSLNELLSRMEEASRVKLTGWSPFVNLYRSPFEPRPVEGMVETWVGDPTGDIWRRDSASCDFWRADRAGNFFLLRGYDEDSSERVTSGAAMDIALPIWRVGETLLFAARLARLFGENPEILVVCQYSGLQNRQLINMNGFSGSLFRRESLDNMVTLETQATASQIEDNLVEIVHLLLRPLYERFGFFELSSTLIANQIEQLRSGRY